MFGKHKKKDSDDVANFTGEPPRTALTDPPPGYQTPSPEQPYGVGKAKPVAPTSSDYMINASGRRTVSRLAVCAGAPVARRPA